MKETAEAPRRAARPLPDGGHWLTPDETRRAVNLHRCIVRDPARFLKYDMRLVVDLEVRLVTRTVSGDSAVVVIQYPPSFNPVRIVGDRLEWVEPPSGIAASGYEYRTTRHTHH